MYICFSICAAYGQFVLNLSCWKGSEIIKIINKSVLSFLVVIWIVAAIISSPDVYLAVVNKNIGKEEGRENET